VTDVVDGDTIKVLSRGFETTVRLLGIDTPETRRPGGFVQCFGPAASARTRRLLPNGQDVRLVTDVSQDRRDGYGRLLAYVYKPGKSGARGSVNHALVATGYAKVYIYRANPFRHAGPFEEAEARARRRAIGLWGEPCRGNTSKRDPATIPPPSTTPSSLAGATSGAPSRGKFDSNHRGACVPSYPPDVDCADVTGSVTVVGRDPHRLDGEGNRVDCE
jgi:micrococcal nuclease